MELNHPTLDPFDAREDTCNDAPVPLEQRSSAAGLHRAAHAGASARVEGHPHPFQAFLDKLPVGVFVLDGAGRPFYANAAAQAILGAGIAPDAAPDQLAHVYQAYVSGTDQRYPAEQMPVVRALAGVSSSIDNMEIRQHDRSIPLDVTATPVYDSAGEVLYAMAVFTDITERRRAEAIRHENILQEEVIRAQSLALRELSTPLFPISDEVIVMPLIGTIDSLRAQQIIETLLEGIESKRAQRVILDITGVPIVDTQVASVLVKAAQAAQLLGAQVVLTGIRPEVAQTMVGLGVSLGSVVTRGTLQAGIATALGRL